MLTSNIYILGVFFIFLAIPLVTGYFGLTARDPVLSIIFNLEDNNSIEGGRKRVSNSKLCEMMKLHRKQKRMCRRGRGVAQTLVDAMHISARECHEQFQNERWNCSLKDPYRQNVLRKGFKETSFLYAMSSAGLVHAFARACSSGRLDRCTCDESKHLQNKEAWRWGGCGDNIKFGLKFTRRFLRRAKRGKDVRSKINQHNSRVGIKVVKHYVNTTCKCHGVSGSCTVRTCWRQLSPINKIGYVLKNKYEKATVFTETNEANSKYKLPRRRKHSNQLSELSTSMDLKYIDKSPSYCLKTGFSAGTVGRKCDKDSTCQSLCCGRGYNVQTKIVKRHCQCQVIWCCEFKCKVCHAPQEMYTCK